AGGTVIWGDLVTNRMTDTNWYDTYRDIEDNVGNTQRPIMWVEAEVTGLTLPAGTYWIQYFFSGSLSSGPWAPPVTILGESTTGNAKQYQSTGIWVDLIDVGGQGMPFVVNGEEIG